jgi:hypothetical protein
MFTPEMVAKSYRQSNSISLVADPVARSYLLGMEIRDIRRANLARLVREAGLEPLANMADTSEKTLLQLLAGTPLDSGNPRSVGHDLARRLESATGRERGWMDVVHDDTLPTEAQEVIERVRSSVLTGRLGIEQIRAIYDVVKAMEH